MVERRRGDILNIASTAGERGAANTSAYVASKAALLRFNDALMYEARKYDTLQLPARAFVRDVAVLTTNPV